MALHDNQGEDGLNGISPRTTAAFTIAAVADRICIGFAQFSGNSAAVGTVTMTGPGGASMTKIAGGDWSGGTRSQFLFILTGDGNVLTGSRTCTVSWTGGFSGTCYVGAIVCNGAPGGYDAPVTNSGNGTTAQSIVTTNNADVALVFHSDDNGTSPAKTVDDGTTAWLDTALDTNCGAAWDEATAVTSTQGWTWTGAVNWSNISINIRNSAGGGPGLLMQSQICL